MARGGSTRFTAERVKAMRHARNLGPANAVRVARAHDPVAVAFKQARKMAYDRAYQAKRRARDRSRRAMVRWLFDSKRKK